MNQVGFARLFIRKDSSLLTLPTCHHFPLSRKAYDAIFPVTESDDYFATCRKECQLFGQFFPWSWMFPPHESPSILQDIDFICDSFVYLDRFTWIDFLATPDLPVLLLPAMPRRATAVGGSFASAVHFTGCFVFRTLRESKF